MDLMVHGKGQQSHHSLKHYKRVSYTSEVEDYRIKSKHSRPSVVQKSRNSMKAPRKGSYEVYDTKSTNNYTSWGVFDANYESKTSYYGQQRPRKYDKRDLAGYATSYASYATKHAKPAYNKAFFSDNHSRSTNDSSNSDNESSELNGFKVMMDGKILHDETTEEHDHTVKNEPIFQSFPTREKFASSEMTVGPKANEISIPSFL